MTEVEGRALCDARAASCRCYKDAGHAPADPVHECDERRCTGAWIGDPDDPASPFTIIRLPFPVPGGHSGPWDTP